MTTGRINQVTIPQGTPKAGTLWPGLPFFQRMPAFYSPSASASASAIRAARQDALSGGTPLYLCHVFPLLHPSKLQAYHWGLASPGNAKKIHQGRTILRNLSLYSWPKAIRYNIHPFSRCLHRDNLPTIRSFPAIKEANLLNIAPSCSICHHFVPGNTFPSRAYSYGPNAAQQLLRSFPMPALTLVPEIVYS